MITPSDKTASEQYAEEFDEWQAAVERNNARLAELDEAKHRMEMLEQAVQFSSPDTTRAEKLEAVVRCAAEKLRMGDFTGALLTLEAGMRI